MITRVRNISPSANPYIVATPQTTPILAHKCDDCGKPINPTNWIKVVDCGEIVKVCKGCSTKDFKTGRTIKVGKVAEGWKVWVDNQWDSVYYPTRDKARKAAKLV